MRKRVGYGAAMVHAAVAPQAVALRARLKRLVVVSERARTWWTLGGCCLIVLLLRAPYLAVPLGRDEGGLAFLARHWEGGSLYGAYWVDRPPLLIGLFKVAVLGGDRGVRVLGALAALALVLLIALLARAVAGSQAARIAGLLAALLAGSVSIGAVYTPGELLAAVPSTLSVLCLVLAHRSRQSRFVVAAGVAAMSAVLVKQSFLDAGFAGVAFVAASAASDRDVRLRWPAAYVAGATIPLGVVLVWLAVAGRSVSFFTYTLFGFRLDLLHTLADSNNPLRERLRQLEEPAWDSGLTVVLIGAVVGLLTLIRDRVLLVTFGAWLAAATVGVLGGGSYFNHYLIELVAVGCVAASLVIARAPMPIGVAALGVVAYLALTAANEGVKYIDLKTPHRRELAVGRYIRDHARAGDTQYVMYARPNVVYYARLRQPYPYLWSLMVRVRPGARTQLLRLLGSSRRPTWLVRWHHPSSWELDPDHSVARAIQRGYRRAAVVCNIPIYVRNDRPRPPGVAVGACPTHVAWTSLG
jgi:Dolichyl-phosphate-mannose-protein mannosyltransferase